MDCSRYSTISSGGELATISRIPLLFVQAEAQLLTLAGLNAVIVMHVSYPFHNEDHYRVILITSASVTPSCGISQDQRPKS